MTSPPEPPSPFQEERGNRGEVLSSHLWQDQSSLSLIENFLHLKWRRAEFLNQALNTNHPLNFNFSFPEPSPGECG